MIVCQSGRFGVAAPTTSYANAGGTGDRLALITVLSTSGTAGSTDRLIDGALSVGFYFLAGSGTQITYDFLSDKIIDGFKFYQDTASTHGGWVVEASASSSGPWTEVKSSFTLGGALTTEYTFTNSTAYRYYRWRNVSGSSSDAPWVIEMEFRISA